jgi:hypothetical protein
LRTLAVGLCILVLRAAQRLNNQEMSAWWAPSSCASWVCVCSSQDCSATRFPASTPTRVRMVVSTPFSKRPLLHKVRCNSQTPPPPQTQQPIHH